MAFAVVAEPPVQYEAWAASQRAPVAGVLGTSVAASDTLRRGQQLFVDGNCASCHTVRGTPATGLIGPDLTHLMSRQTIAAGTLANSHDNLSTWIAEPGSVKPGTTMPASRFAPADLQSLVAWLETLK
jgi:cytochrome c oxidase subunit 2